MTPSEFPSWSVGPSSSAVGQQDAAFDGLESGNVGIDFSRWIAAHAHPLAERWFAGLKLGPASSPQQDGVHEVISAFFDVLLELLPHAVGPLRDSVEPLWSQAAELYGTFAAQRGLAAGEVIEEFQLLREGILRLLWADPPEIETDRIALREILRLNRVLDRGVTAASVGHTDALFFALFQSSGLPQRMSDDLRYEMREQLQVLRHELKTVIAAAAKSSKNRT